MGDNHYPALKAPSSANIGFADRYGFDRHHHARTGRYWTSLNRGHPWYAQNGVILDARFSQCIPASGRRRNAYTSPIHSALSSGCSTRIQSSAESDSAFLSARKARENQMIAQGSENSFLQISPSFCPSASSRIFVTYGAPTTLMSQPRSWPLTAERAPASFQYAPSPTPAIRCVPAIILSSGRNTSMSATLRWM